MEKLIKLAKDGDTEAFSSWIYEIRHELYKVARCRLSCESDIDDAIQETMIEAFKNIKKLKKIESAKKWIITILVNKCNSIYKKNKNSNVSFENQEIENYYMVYEEYKKLEELDFYTMLKDLNYDERIVLVLFYLEDYSIKEIAKILKQNENTVKTRLKRGKEKIKKRYFKGE